MNGPLILLLLSYLQAPSDLARMFFFPLSKWLYPIEVFRCCSTSCALATLVWLVRKHRLPPKFICSCHFIFPCLLKFCVYCEIIKRKSAQAHSACLARGHHILVLDRNSCKNSLYNTHNVCCYCCYQEALGLCEYN